VGFTVTGDTTLPDEELRALSGVTAVRRENGTIELTSTELGLTLPSLLAYMDRRQLRASELRTHSATLEDVFVSLTGRHLRDA